MKKNEEGKGRDVIVYYANTAISNRYPLLSNATTP